MLSRRSPGANRSAGGRPRGTRAPGAGAAAVSAGRPASLPGTAHVLLSQRLGTPGPAPPARQRSVALTAGEEHQAVLADLDLVAVVQRHLVDPLPVDVGAVEAAHVGDCEAGRGAAELDVAPRDGDVVEEDVALRV